MTLDSNPLVRRRDIRRAYIHRMPFDIDLVRAVLHALKVEPDHPHRDSFDWSFNPWLEDLAHLVEVPDREMESPFDGMRIFNVTVGPGKHRIPLKYLAPFHTDDYDYTEAQAGEVLVTMSNLLSHCHLLYGQGPGCFCTHAFAEKGSLLEYVSSEVYVPGDDAGLPWIYPLMSDFSDYYF